jgi:hypothetical protein
MQIKDSFSTVLEAAKDATFVLLSGQQQTLIYTGRSCSS